MEEEEDDFLDNYIKTILSDTIKNEYNEYADGTRMSKPPDNLFY
jgi:hypothetical protein